MHSISIFVPCHQKSGNRQEAFVDHEQDGAEAMCKQQKETLIRNRIGTVQLYGALLRKNGISGQLLCVCARICVYFESTLTELLIYRLGITIFLLNPFSTFVHLCQN